MMDNPYQAPPSDSLGPFATKAPDDVDLAIVAPLYRGAGWIRFLGILAIIVGAIYCISIIGLVVGWIPLWIGVLLLRSATAIRIGYDTGDSAFLLSGTEQLARAIKILAIALAAAIVLYAVTLITLMVVNATG